MTTVSVIVPTYNRGPRLRRTIESVLNQRFTDFELIIVDDASTDDTEEVVNAFDDQRIRYLIHDTNRGGSVARNTGIDVSEGEYIAFLDDDDEWHPRKLDRQINRLEERSGEWIAIHCDFEVIRNGVTQRLRRRVTDFRHGDFPKPRLEGGAELIPGVLMDKYRFCGTSALLVRRSTLDHLEGFDPKFPRHQDWEFLVRLLRVGKLAYVDESLVTKQESGHPSADTLREAKNALFTEFAPEIERAEQAGYDVVGTHRFSLATSYYREGRYLRGSRYLRGAKIDSLRLLHALCIGACSKIRRRRSTERS